MQVDLLQDARAVPGAGGDLGGRASGVQPQGQGGVPQVIGAAGERGDGQFRAEGGLAGGVPGAAVDRLVEHAGAGAAEQSPVRRGAMVAEMTAEHADQDGQDGDDADRSVGAVLEAVGAARTGCQEDKSLIRTRNVPRVMASPRSLAISLLRLAGHANIAAANRHHAL
ncbi:MAG TPA: hypothetical protein VMK84_30725 [Streptosporangiaceae bacterium]|nr:hypothetical protein [Streptosporangiaceae bacterium]